MATIQVEISPERQEIYAKLKEQYNPEGSKLRDYQLHLVKTLIEFDKFCKAHNIQYSLAFGTLLGAIRHKGFIPWDDDADLYMTRENANKLLSLAKGQYHELNDKISIAMGIRPELWMAPYAYIDIFIIDKAPKNKCVDWLKLRLSQLMYGMIKSRGALENHIWKSKWHVFLPFAIWASQKKWKQKWEKLAQWKNNEPKATYARVYNECFVPMKRRYKLQDISDYDQVMFEGYEFPIFKGYDSILKLCYGAYMMLPNRLHEHGTIEMLAEQNIQI